MKKQFFTLLFLIIIFQSLKCFGQNLPDSTNIFRIETKDGNIFIGSVIAQDSLTLVLKTESFGEIKIPLIKIKSKTELFEVKKVGRYAVVLIPARAADAR